MNLLHVYHTGSMTRRYHEILDFMNGMEWINLTYANIAQFSEEPIPDYIDILTYQTFPDEHLPKKFNPQLVIRADKNFRDFKKPKILVDLHEDTSKDAFSRFSNSRELPRVKWSPTQKFMREFNVVFPIRKTVNKSVQARRFFDYLEDLFPF